MTDAARIAEIRARWAAMDVSAIVPQDDVDWLQDQLAQRDAQLVEAVRLLRQAKAELDLEPDCVAQARAIGDFLDRIGGA